MQPYRSNDYDDFLEWGNSISSLEELLNDVEGGDSCEVAFDRSMPVGSVNERYEIIMPNHSTTILYDKTSKKKVFVTEKSRRVLAGKIKSRIKDLEHEELMNDDCAKFLRNAFDADELYELEQIVSGEPFHGTRWADFIQVGKVNDRYEIAQEGNDYVVIDHNNDDEKFNISRYGEREFLSTLRHVLEQEYCCGLDYHTYRALDNQE